VFELIIVVFIIAQTTVINSAVVLTR